MSRLNVNILGASVYQTINWTHFLDIYTASAILLAEISQWKLSHEHCEQFHELPQLKASKTIMHLVSQNLHTGNWHATFSQLNITCTCHPMFAFYKNRNFIMGWSWILENSTVSVDIVQSMIWKKFRNKCKDPPNRHFTVLMTLFSCSDKITIKFWEVDCIENISAFHITKILSIY